MSSGCLKKFQAEKGIYHRGTEAQRLHRDIRTLNPLCIVFVISLCVSVVKRIIN